MLKNKKDNLGKISAQLLIILLPMIALFIIVAAVVVLTRSKDVIIETAQAELENESTANANDIGGRIGQIMSYYNAVADLASQTKYEEQQDVLDQLAIAMSAFDETPSGVYIGMSNKEYIDPSGWVPDAGYDPTERDWYKDGLNNEKMAAGESYIDMDSNSMVVSISRVITFKDGRSGVVSSDVNLSAISENVAQYTPGKTGNAVLFDGETILASVNTDYNGKLASELSSDPFMQKLGSAVASGETNTIVIKGNGGKEYYVSFDPVPNTNWTMVSYVPKADVLASVTTLNYVTAILLVIMLAISTVVIMLIISKKITAPVGELTENIVRIADGDFTVDIKKGGNNEIGVMNNRMHDYVEQMRETLGQMKLVTNQLSEEAVNSRSASSSLNIQASDQSQSMDNIHTAMEEVARSVTELATNATELAQSVGTMMEEGNTAGRTMEALLSKAKQGQKDMENVQRNMKDISVSMNEMNDVVKTVDEAAQKINTIVEMINSISSQTNLLSLNASIEAARAGEAGKGFAVVATEIGNLANESANATTEISEIITDITTQIKKLSEKSEASSTEIASSSEAVSVTEQSFNDIFQSLDETGMLVRSMLSMMNRVNEIATSVAAISEEQAASTEEVTATVDTAASSAESVAHESQEVDQSAETVAESAEKIESFVNQFKI